MAAAQVGREPDTPALMAWLHAAHFDDVDEDGSLKVSRAEVARSLCRALGRFPTEPELDFVWAKLNACGTAELLDFEDWELAQGSASAEALTGVARAMGGTLLRSTVRVLPRTPAVSFFRPKTAAEGEPAVLRLLRLLRAPDLLNVRELGSRVGAAAHFMGVSALAATCLFKAHRAVCTYGLGIGHDGMYAAEDPLTRGSFAGNCLGGAVGGAAHSVIMCPMAAKPWVSLAPLGPAEAIAVAHGARSPAAARVRTAVSSLSRAYSGLPVVVLRDVAGFAAFFGAFNAAIKALEGYRPPLAHARESLDGGITHAQGTRGIMQTVAAGGAGGLAYHSVTYPIERTAQLCARAQSWREVVRALCAGGPNFRGFWRSSLQHTATGAITFAAYDSAMHLILEI
ncbi:hypothetical protein T492DRAFT_962789 [Pavlovales sp. CCMP2436]|nr:hypothetical protein T492DRAFT_962789 [Pavlovales sp. CCMP2436]